MRYALAVSPKNYLLFGCHFINCSSQLVQGYRYVQYFNLGGREAAFKAKEAAQAVQAKGEGVLAQAVDKAKDVAGKTVGK